MSRSVRPSPRDPVIIRHRVRADGLALIVDGDEGMRLLVRIHTDVHAAFLHPQSENQHAGATGLYGEIHTLPLSLPPGAWSEEGDSSHASVTTQRSPESAPFPDTLERFANSLAG